MHYHLEPVATHSRFDKQKLLGFACLAVFLVLIGTVWLPYAKAIVNATAITVLPGDWSRDYAAAALPKVSAATTNRLVIKTSALQIEAPIVDGVDPESLLQGVGHDPASSDPGEQGRMILSGHRFWLSNSPWATVFFSLDKLKIGDKITLHYEGKTYTYKVTESWNVPKDKATPYLAPTTAPILTLYTCGPTPYSAKNRLGFHAILEEDKIKKDSPKVIDALTEGVL